MNAQPNSWESAQKEKSFQESKPARTLRGERSTAAASSSGVRVGKLETAAMKAGDEVDDGAGQILSAGAIDIDRDAGKLEHHIVRLRLIFEVELVGKAGTAAIGDSDT